METCITFINEPNSESNRPSDTYRCAQSYMIAVAMSIANLAFVMIEKGLQLYPYTYVSWYSNAAWGCVRLTLSSVHNASLRDALV